CDFCRPAAGSRAGQPDAQDARGGQSARRHAPQRQLTESNVVTGDALLAPDKETYATMKNAWFETVAEAQRRARKRLPRSVCGALVAGSEKMTCSGPVRGRACRPMVAPGNEGGDLPSTARHDVVCRPAGLGAWGGHPDAVNRRRG